MLNPPQSREVHKDRAKESVMIRFLLFFAQPFFILCVFAVGVGLLDAITHWRQDP